MNARKCFRAFMIRLSCVQNGLCPDYRAFKVAYVQTIVRSKLPMIRLSCVPSCICPDYRAFKIAYVQTIVRSKLHMSRLSCVQNCICPDYRAFIFFSRPCNFERTTPPCAFILVWTYRLSVWHLNLGVDTATPGITGCSWNLCCRLKSIGCLKPKRIIKRML